MLYHTTRRNAGANDTPSLTLPLHPRLDVKAGEVEVKVSGQREA